MQIVGQYIDGYQSVDTFYQSQLKIALVMQRFI